jgi:phage FluMu protein Com
MPLIEIKCDRCEQIFEVAEPPADGKVTCPRCGDVNRVAAVEAMRGQAPAPSMRSAPTSQMVGREQTLLVVRQPMFRAHPGWYSLMVLLFIGGIVACFVPGGLVFGLPIAGVALLWWLIWWAAPHRWVKLTITNKRTIRQEGIVMRKTSEVLHNHIRGIKIEQSVIDRLLNVGDLSIDSAGGSEAEPIEIRMNDAPGPYAIKELIDRHRKL